MFYYIAFKKSVLSATLQQVAITISQLDDWSVADTCCRYVADKVSATLEVYKLSGWFIESMQ